MIFIVCLLNFHGRVTFIMTNIQIIFYFNFVAGPYTAPKVTMNLGYPGSLKVWSHIKRSWEQTHGFMLRDVSCHSLKTWPNT